MSNYETYIFINKDQSYEFRHLNNVLNVDVEGDVPYDKITGLFKKYTYKINHPEERYNPSDNVIYIYDGNAWLGWKYRFTYYYPRKMVKSFELYFPFSDKNTTPLVVGINEGPSGSTKYHTYNFLKGEVKAYHKFPSKYFNNEDLLTRLTEELSLFTKTRDNKMVIRSEFKASSSKKLYPNTGRHPKKITITKSGNSGYEDFDKHDHEISPTSTVSSFYLGRNNNVLYINADKDFRQGLKSAEFYFSNKIKRHVPLIVKFVGKSEENYKKYYSLRELFYNKVSEIKLDTIKDIDENNLKSRLDEEADFNQNIIWHHIDKSGPHSNIASFSYVSRNTRDSYVEYSHSKDINSKDKFVKIALNNKVLKLGENDKFGKISDLSSYYLTLSIKNDQEDTVPFLISLTLDTADSARKTTYYSKKNDSDQNWSEVKINGYRELMPKLSQINQIAPRQNDFEEFRKEVYTILKGGNKNPLVEGHSPSTRSGNTEDSGSKGSVLGSGSEPGLGGSRTHGGALGKGRGGRVETTRLGTSNSLQNSHTRTEPSETRGTPKDHPSKQNTESLPNSHHSGSSEVNLPSTEQERLRDSGVLPAVSPQDSLNSDKGQSDTNHVEDSNDETDPNGDEHNDDSPPSPNGDENFFVKHRDIIIGVVGGLVGIIIIIVVVVVYKKCVKVRPPSSVEPFL